MKLVTKLITRFVTIGDTWHTRTNSLYISSAGIAGESQTVLRFLRHAGYARILRSYSVVARGIALAAFAAAITSAISRSIPHVIIFARLIIV